MNKNLEQNQGQNKNDNKGEVRMNYKSMKKDELITLLMERDARIEKATVAYKEMVGKYNKALSMVKEIPTAAPTKTPDRILDTMNNGVCKCAICGATISGNVKDYLDRNPKQIPEGYEGHYLCFLCQRDPAGRKAKIAAKLSKSTSTPSINVPVEVVNPAAIPVGPIDSSETSYQALMAMLHEQSMNEVADENASSFDIQ